MIKPYVTDVTAFLTEAIAAFLPDVKLLNIGTVLAKSLPSAIALSEAQTPSRVTYFVSDPDTSFQSIANARLDAIRADNVQTVGIESF